MIVFRSRRTVVRQNCRKNGYTPTGMFRMRLVNSFAHAEIVNERRSTKCRIDTIYRFSRRS
jgi:hypothetical protein